jgi:hypothetical protein
MGVGYTFGTNAEVDLLQLLGVDEEVRKRCVRVARGNNSVLSHRTIVGTTFFYQVVMVKVSGCRNDDFGRLIVVTVKEGK